MSDTDLEVEAACRAVVMAFAHGIDTGQVAEVAALFCVDGVFERRGEALQGRDAILAALRARPASVVTCHLCSTVAIDRQAADRATGRSYFQLYKGERQPGGAAPPALSGPDVVGLYLDRFQRTTDGWRIQHRAASAIFQRP